MPSTPNNKRKRTSPNSSNGSKNKRISAAADVKVNSKSQSVKEKVTPAAAAVPVAVSVVGKASLDAVKEGSNGNANGAVSRKCIPVMAKKAAVVSVAPVSNPAPVLSPAANSDVDPAPAPTLNGDSKHVKSEGESIAAVSPTKIPGPEHDHTHEIEKIKVGVHAGLLISFLLMSILCVSAYISKAQQQELIHRASLLVDAADLSDPSVKSKSSYYEEILKDILHPHQAHELRVEYESKISLLESENKNLLNEINLKNAIVEQLQLKLENLEKGGSSEDDL